MKEGRDDTSEGYWVNSEEKNITLMAKPVSYPVKFDLKEGWNLIAYPGAEEKSISECLKEVEGSYEFIMTYEGNWSSYIPNRANNSLQDFTPFSAYWVRTNQSRAWTFEDGVYK